MVKLNSCSYNYYIGVRVRLGLGFVGQRGGVRVRIVELSKVPITDIYCPVDSPDLNRDNYIMCELKSTTQSNGQVTIAYNVDNSSLDNIRAFI